jgi:NDP-sugar pyrophosphorylase family protein
MKAMILAAGLGTRLRPLTDTIPKPLLPVGGAPLILWNLLWLRAGGIGDVIINLHYLGHLIEDAIGDGSRWDMRVRYSYEPTLLGTGGGLKQAEGFFEKQPFLVINGDTLIDVDLNELREFHHTHGGVATLVLRDDPHAAQWGAVESDAQNRIFTINGRGLSQAGVTGHLVTRMFAGVHILHPSILQKAPPGNPFSIIDSYTQELAQGASMFGFVHAGYWSDIGTVERYAHVQADAEAGIISMVSRTSSS